MNGDLAVNGVENFETKHKLETSMENDSIVETNFREKKYLETANSLLISVNKNNMNSTCLTKINATGDSQKACTLLPGRTDELSCESNNNLKDEDQHLDALHDKSALSASCNGDTNDLMKDPNDHAEVDEDMDTSSSNTQSKHEENKKMTEDVFKKQHFSAVPLLNGHAVADEVPSIVHEPFLKRKHSSEVLEWCNNNHQEDLIYRMNVFRKSKQFCDLVLLVGGRELHCHRVVVGGASKAIYDELSRGEQESGPTARIPLDVARLNLIPDAVEILIDYIYTSRLRMPPSLLAEVYRASIQLGIEQVIPVCRKFIISQLNVERCVQARRLSQHYGDTELKQYMDSFIEENFDAVSTSNELLALPRIKMEVMFSPNTSVTNILSVNWRDGMLSTSALAWVYDVIRKQGESYLQDLTEQIKKVSLEDLNDATFNNHGNSYSRRVSQDTELSNLPKGKSQKRFANTRLSRSSSMDSINSSDSGDSLSHIECSLNGEWKVIASVQTTGEHTIALCCVGDTLCTISLRLPNMSYSNGDLNGHSFNGYHNNHTSSSSSTSCSSSVGSVSQISSLNHARCAAGVAEVTGKVVVAGGFNQSDCLDSVECFDPSENRWKVVSRMNEKRARFSVAVLRGLLYAVGGSSGSRDQISVERYDPVKDTWTRVQSMLICCSASGVGVLDDLLYCVGGVQQSTGVAGMKACQVYNPDTDQWQLTGSLRVGRSSIGVAALGGSLYAVAGSDGWKCLDSVEKFDPIIKHWTFTSPLNVHRRGAGLTEHNGALFCVGGSDGQSFLSSVERYCPSEGDVWTLTGAPLVVPRNNVGVASLNGNVLVVGGFSGRHFLSSVEILEEGSGDWTNQDNQSSTGVTSESE